MPLKPHPTDSHKMVYESRKYKLPKREWVGLTKEEINEGLLRSFYVLEKARAWREGVEWAMQQLKDKNNV